VDERNSHSTWRSVLSHCSESLKHLFFRLNWLLPGEESPQLQFINLEMLEMHEVDALVLILDHEVKSLRAVEKVANLSAGV